MSVPQINRRMLLAAVLLMPLLPTRATAQTSGESVMKVKMTFGGHAMTATLYDNPSARDFYSMLPLDLTIEDYSTNEKIAHLPRKLTEEGSGPFTNEQPYDLCYFKPWGNLAMFFEGYKHPGLIRLGRFDAGFDALHVRGKFQLRIEAL